MTVAIVDVMVDLETLGTTPGSVVLSVGAVAHAVPGGEFYGKIDLRDSLHAGLTVDPDTMAWWRQQSQEAWRASAAASEDASLGLRYVLGRFADWLSELRKGSSATATGAKLRLWGDSAAFDLVLLASAYRAAGKVVPWDYREECCYRTLRTLLNSEKPRSKVQHDGLSDAVAQMAHLQEMLTTFGAPP